MNPWFKTSEESRLSIDETGEGERDEVGVVPEAEVVSVDAERSFCIGGMAVAMGAPMKPRRRGGGPQTVCEKNSG